jgi:hypothetical protein
VLSIGDSITDDTLEEGLKDTTGLFVDHWKDALEDVYWRQTRRHTCGDTLDTTTTSETANSGLCNTLDIVTKNLAMALGSALAEALSALSAWEMLVGLHRRQRESERYKH